MTLVEFLRARLDEDEQWALACNRPYEYADEGSKPPETGVHWHWVTGENWEPTKPDPVMMEALQGSDGSWSANLATVERWPSTRRGENGEVIRTSTMPRTYADSINEMDPAAAGHIARHDPARVLAEVDAKRPIIERWAELITEVTHRLGVGDEDAAPVATEWAYEQVARCLAVPYADHPDYDESWRPA